MESLQTYARKLAEAALQLGAIRIDPDHPFTWASGYRMPVYNDNRMLLGQAQYRKLAAEGLRALLASLPHDPDVIAGTATAGIPHATTLANLLDKPLVYVRPTPKAHGMKNQVEGPLEPGQSVAVVEDLVSTGGSSLKVVQALRDAGARVDHCLCLFTYGFPEAEHQFQEAHCSLHALLSFDTLLQHMEQTGALTPVHRKTLEAWRLDPFGWAERHKGGTS